MHVIQQSKRFITFVFKTCIDFFFLDVFNLEEVREGVVEVPDLEDITKVLRSNEASLWLRSL